MGKVIPLIIDSEERMSTDSEDPEAKSINGSETTSIDGPDIQSVNESELISIDDTDKKSTDSPENYDSIMKRLDLIFGS